MNDIKRLGLPLCIIFLSALLIKLIDRYLVFPFTPTLLVLLIVIALFWFGVSLNQNRKRRNPAIFTKVLAILLTVLLMLMQMGYFELPFMKDTFAFFGIDTFFINMIYIFCGYLFAD